MNLSYDSLVYADWEKKCLRFRWKVNNWFFSFMCKAFILLSHSNESVQHSTLQNKTTSSYQY